MAQTVTHGGGRQRKRRTVRLMEVGLLVRYRSTACRNVHTQWSSTCNMEVTVPSLYAYGIRHIHTVLNRAAPSISRIVPSCPTEILCLYTIIPGLSPRLPAVTFLLSSSRTGLLFTFNFFVSLDLKGFSRRWHTRESL